jgi:hypothetical protein
METTKKIEKYIADKNFDGKKIADVLRDYAKGYCELGDICQFYGYSIDKAVSHLKVIGLID